MVKYSNYSNSLEKPYCDFPVCSEMARGVPVKMFRPLLWFLAKVHIHVTSLLLINLSLLEIEICVKHNFHYIIHRLYSTTLSKVQLSLQNSYVLGSGIYLHREY